MPDTSLQTTAARAGVDRIGAYRLELNKLRDNYILVQVNVTGTSLFTRRASFGELGIADADIRRARYTPGGKYIFPRELLGRWRSIENRLRHRLDSLSIPLSGFAPYRALPWTAIDEWRACFEQLEGEAKALADELIAGYDAHVEALANEFEEAARAAWRAITAQGFDGIKIDGTAYTAESAFTAEIVARAIARVPRTDEIQARLRVSYQVARVYGQAEIAADALAAAEIHEREHNLRAEAAHTRAILDIDEEERRQIARAKITAELERAREEHAETTRYVDEIFQTVRERIAAQARELLEGMQKNKDTLRGKSAERGARLLDVYNTLGGCIHNDRALEETLARLRGEIGAVGNRTKTTPARDTEAIRKTLEAVVDLAEGELADLTEDSRASFIELD